MQVHGDGYSANGEPYVPVGIPANSGAITIPDTKKFDPKTLQPADSGAVSLEQSRGEQQQTAAMVKGWLASQSDTTSQDAKIKVTRYMAAKTGLKFQDLWDTYDQSMEKIFGFTMEPKSAAKFITDQFSNANIDTKIYELRSEMLANPDLDEGYINAQLEKLKASKAPFDPYKHNILIDFSAASAAMIPYMWQVGKSVLPGVVLGVGAGLLSGGTGAVAEAAVTTQKVAKLVSLWGKVQSFAKGFELTSGSIYDDMKAYKDDKGNELDDGIARKLAMEAALPSAALEAIGVGYFVTGNSVFKSIVKKIGEKAFKEKLELAAAKTMTGLSIKGFFETQAKKMVKRTGEMLVHEILLEEVPQDMIEVQATEMAKHFTNDLGAEFQDITSKERIDRTMNVIIQSFKGMMLLGLGRSSLSVAKDFNTYAQNREIKYNADISATAQAGRNELIDTYATSDNEEELSVIEDMLAEQQKPINETKVSIEGDTVEAKNASQESLGHAKYDIKGDVVVVTDLTTKDVDTGNFVMAKLKEAYPDKRVVFSTEITNQKEVARLIEDGDLEMARQNVKLDYERTTIQSANAVIDSYTKMVDEAKQELKDAKDEDAIAEINQRISGLEKSIEEEKSTIDVSNETIKRIEGVKELLATPKKATHQMTKEEYQKTIQFPKEESQRFINTDKGQELLKKLDMSAMSESEKEASVNLLDMIAKAKGLSTDKMASEYFQDGIVAKQKEGETRASVEMKDFKALIKLSKESNFKSWVHEVGHVLKQHLSETELKTAEKWIKDVSGHEPKNGKWTTAMQETFAEGFVRYIYDGKVDSKGIKKIFDKLSRLLRSVYDAVKNLPELSDEIRKVFENQLSNEHIDAMEQNDNLDKMELFESEYTTKIKEAVDQGKIVPDEILQQFDTDWAKNELEKRKTEKQMLDDMGDFTDMAKGVSLEKFLSDADMYMEEYSEKLDSKSKEWLTKFYEVANKDTEIKDINTGNKEWASKVNEDYVKGLIMAVSKDVSGADSAGMATTIVAAARRYLSKKDFRPKTLGIIEQTLKNNPSEYRSIASEYLGDFEEVRQVELEKEFSKEIEVVEDVPIKKLRAERMDIADEMADVADKKMVQNNEITDKKVEKLMSEGSKEIKKIRNNISELNNNIKALEEKHDQRLDSMIKSRKKEIAKQAQELKDKLAEQKKELRAKEKEKKSKQKFRDYIKKLGKQITKKAPMTVDANYRKAIERIQEQVDPHNRRETTMQKRVALRDLYEENPELTKLIPKKKLAELYAKPLNEWTVNELEDMKEQIDQLTYQGRYIQKIKNLAKKNLTEKDVSNALREVLKNGTLDEALYDNGEGKTKKTKITEAFLKTVRAPRLLNMLDGGKGAKGEEYNGVIYRVVWDGITEAYNKEIVQKRRRQVGLMNKMKELGLNRYSLDRKIKVKGISMSADAVLDVWAGLQNKRKAAIIEDNNRITPEISKELIKQLKPNEIALGQWIMKDYAESFERLREAFYNDKNIIIDAEENYTPIRVIMNGMTADEMDVYKEIMGRNQIMPSLQKGMTKNRVSHDHPIQLGILSTWHGAVTKEEHYINNVDKMKHIRSVLGNKELVRAIDSVGKTPQLKEVNDWLKRYANPLANKSNKGWDRSIRVLKQNAAVAYLWGNIMTMAKQIPSIAYFAAYSGPDFFTGMFSNFSETRALMDKWSPELTTGRSFEAFVSSVKNQSSSKGMDIIRRMGSAGLMGIEMFDKGVITVGWRGVFEHGKRHGLSEKEAARKATQAVLLTQPASGVKDTAAIYADDNMLSMFLMFTNQLNQIFLSLSYDAPQAIMHKRFAKAMSIYMGSAIGAVALWMISNRRPPEKDDMVDVFTDQFFSIIPGLGKIMGGYVDGYDLSLPALAPVVGVSAGLEVAKGLLQGEKPTGKQLELMLNTMYEGFAIGVGLPYTEANRLYKGFKEGHALEYMIFGGKLNDK